MQPATSPTDRFLMSSDGMACGWFELQAMANLPGWIDCTDMDDQSFQCLLAERQAVRPYIVN